MREAVRDVARDVAHDAAHEVAHDAVHEVAHAAAHDALQPLLPNLAIRVAFSCQPLSSASVRSLAAQVGWQFYLRKCTTFAPTSCDFPAGDAPALPALPLRVATCEFRDGAAAQRANMCFFEASLVLWL